MFRLPWVPTGDSSVFQYWAADNNNCYSTPKYLSDCLWGFTHEHDTETDMTTGQVNLPPDISLLSTRFQTTLTLTSAEITRHVFTK